MKGNKGDFESQLCLLLIMRPLGLHSLLRKTGDNNTYLLKKSQGLNICVQSPLRTVPGM